jgi:hypothetical protein
VLPVLQSPPLLPHGGYRNFIERSDGKAFECSVADMGARQAWLRAHQPLTQSASVGELIVGFFDHMCERGAAATAATAMDRSPHGVPPPLDRRLVVSIRTGTLLSRGETGFESPLPIEDPFETTRDLGCTLTPATHDVLRTELARARSLLRGAQERNQAQPEAAVRLAAWRDALQELAAPKAAGPR